MVPLKDKTPQGDPDTVVSLPTGTLVGLAIRGVPGQVVLGIREDTEGQPVSCAEITELRITYPPSQSNPHRLKHHYDRMADDL